MPTYVFQAADGEVMEKFASITSMWATCRKWTRPSDKKLFVRTMEAPAEIRNEFKPYVSVTVPKGMPGHPTCPKTGRTVVLSRAAEKKIAQATTGLRPSQQDWD